MGLAMTACGGTEEPPPSCAQAMNAYYGAGCIFDNLETGGTFSLTEATYTCNMVTVDTPPACDDELDDWLVCLYETSPGDVCDCTVWQMALLRCL
jgi:hypothetical protein